MRKHFKRKQVACRHPNQWAPWHCLSQDFSQSQHQPSPHRTHTICMQPPETAFDDLDHVALCPQKQGCLLGTGTGGGGWKRAREWRLDCGYRLKETMDCCQNNGSVMAVSPHHCTVTNALRNCCFNYHAGQSHKDNVRCTAVEEQPEAKEVQLSQPSSTSLLMISSGLTWGSSSTSLL